MTIRRAWELFHKAKSYFSVDSMTDREQLIAAMHEVHHLLECDTPEEFLDEIRNLSTELAKVDPLGCEGSIAATVEQLADDEVQGYRERIIDIDRWFTEMRGER